MAGNTPDFGELKADMHLRIAIVRSVWHGELTRALTDDAVKTLIAAGAARDNIQLIDAPGSYELPLLAKRALESGVHGAIVFGVVVEGDTHHARLIAEQAAAGCMQVQLEAGKPVIFEVLYVDDIADARARSTGKNGKGPLAARTLLKQLDEMKKLRRKA